MQRGYEYLLTKPTGKDFAPGFKPELTPKQMLRLGVFGGKYMTDCKAEFPSDWFAKARLCSERHAPELNFFRVNASQPLSVWRRKGWIYPKTRAAGFNGIAVTISGGVVPMTSARSSGGGRSAVISRS